MITAKAILPKNKFNPDVFRQEAQRAMRENAKGIVTDENKIVATWKRKVKFESEVTVGETVNLRVWTDDVIYNMLDKGTRKHPIPKHPKPKGKWLAFNSKFTPKTKPRFIGSGAGGSSPPIWFAKQVQHPGTKPRKWTEELFKRWRSRIYNSVSVAFSRAAKESRHAIY